MIKELRFKVELVHDVSLSDAVIGCLRIYWTLISCCLATNKVWTWCLFRPKHGPPWSEKNATAFWRGRDSRHKRLEVVKLSRAHLDVTDADFTNFFFKRDESFYGPLVKRVSFFDFLKVRLLRYGYQSHLTKMLDSIVNYFLLEGFMKMFVWMLMQHADTFSSFRRRLLRLLVFIISILLKKFKYL